MNQFAKIVDHKHLVRDLSTKAILNTDLSIVKKHEKHIHDLQKEEARETEINTIKSELSEIKQLLGALLSARKIEV